MSSVTTNLLHGGHTGKSQVLEEISQTNQSILRTQKDTLQKYETQLNKVLAEINSIDIIDVIDNKPLKEKLDKYETAKDMLYSRIEKLRIEITGSEAANTSNKKVSTRNNDIKVIKYENDTQMSEQEKFDINTDLSGMTTKNTRKHLRSRKDSDGEYYECTRTDATEVKFYYKQDLAKMSQELTRLTEYPQWCEALSEFCNFWDFDNVTTHEKLSDSEEEILRLVIEKSLKNEFKELCYNCSTATEVFEKIHHHMVQQCPRQLKDEKWDKMRIDETCSNIPDMNRQLNLLVMMEIYTENELEIRVTRSMLNDRIKRTLSDHLRTAISFEFPDHKDFQTFPKDLIEGIKNKIYDYRRRSRIMIQESRKCFNCDSELHSQRNCYKRRQEGDYERFTKRTPDQEYVIKENYQDRSSSKSDPTLRH